MASAMVYHFRSYNVTISLFRSGSMTSLPTDPQGIRNTTLSSCRNALYNDYDWLSIKSIFQEVANSDARAGRKAQKYERKVGNDEFRTFASALKFTVRFRALIYKRPGQIFPAKASSCETTNFCVCNFCE